VLAIIILAMLLVTSPAFQALLGSMFSNARTYPAEVRAELIRELSIDASGGEVVDFTASVVVPQDIYIEGELVQEVISISYDPAPDTETVNGTEWSVWEGGPLSGDDSFVSTVSYEVALHAYTWDIGPEDSLDIDDIPSSYDAYCGGEWLIDPISSDVAELSGEIVDGEENVLLSLRAIYDWMVDNVRYPAVTGGSPQSPQETMTSLVGDCDDQSILFCSLARAAGIPTWLQIGLLYDSSSNIWGGHAWVETFIPTEDGGHEVVIDTVNREFMVWDSYRILEFTSDGVGGHLQDYYQYFECHIVPSTYPPSGGPELSQEFIAVSYQESDGLLLVG
jgi:hypothetical protein